MRTGNDIRPRWIEAVLAAHPGDIQVTLLVGHIACLSDAAGWHELPERALRFASPIAGAKGIRKHLHRDGWLSIPVPADAELRTCHAWRLTFPPDQPNTLREDHQ